MPPKKKIQKEDIINTSYEIVKNEGMEALNARKIAKKLNCSIQPIFHNFTNMEELKSEVLNKIYNTYKELIFSKSSEEYAYKNIGLSYIKFAKEYPNFFKLLFMQESKLKPEEFIMSDSTSDNIIKTGQKLTGLNYEEQKKFHLKVWVFTHGLACLAATNTCNFTDEEFNDLLGSSVIQMLNGYKGERVNEENN